MIFESMTRFFLHIYHYFSARRLWASAVLLTICALATLLSSRVHYEEDIAKFLPHDAQNEKYQDVYEQIALQSRVAVLFSSKDSLRPVDTETIGQAMESFGKQIENSPLIEQLQVSADETAALKMIDFVNTNYPYFITNSDARHIDSLLRSPDFVARQMEENKKILMLPTGGIAMTTLRHDPLHLFTPVLQRMQRFRMDRQFQLIDGYVFTHDGRTGMVTFNSRFGASETQRNGEIAALLDSAARTIEARYPQLKVSAIGAPLIAVTNATTIKTDAIVAVAIASVFILLLLWWHYRRLSDMLWIGVSIVFGWLFAIGGMALFHDSVSMIVLGIGSVIIGIAVNYPLHFLDHIREVGNRRQALKEMVPPLLIGNVTTVAAFLCLVWLDAQAMRDLGLFGALMLIGTILFVLVFLPLYARRPAAAPQHRAGILLPLMERAENWLNRKAVKRVVLPTVMMLTMVFGYFSTKTSFDSDLTHINYMTPDQRADMQRLAGTQHEAALYAVAEGKTMKQAFQANDRLLSQLQAHGYQPHGIGDFSPTAERQRASLTAWRQLWTIHDARQLIDRVKAEARRQGLKPDAFQPFYELLMTDHNSVRPLSYFNPILQPFVGTYILQSPDQTRIVNYLPSAGADSILKRDINQQAAAPYFVFSSKDIGNQLVRVLNDSFNYIGLVCGFVVFFFLWLSFGKLELSLLSFLPLAVSWLWILGMMQIGGIQFNIVNIILATFIFGQGDDYTIFITEGLMYEHTTGRKRLSSYKHSVAISALLMFIGIGSLILARHPAMRSLAVVTIIGMFTVVIMAYYLPPLVFRWLVRGRHLPTEEPSDAQLWITDKLPLTLRRIVSSLSFMIFFLLFMYFGAKPYTRWFFRKKKDDPERRDRYHRLFQSLARKGLKLLPGVKCHIYNKVGETFEKPAVIICNHQSHLDIMAVLQLSPKIIIITNAWTWNNPFYGDVLHYGDFLPAADGLDKNMTKLRELYKAGYNIVIYPEGTRSETCEVRRFHKGAFYVAHELGADILPLYLHGAGYVLPKRDFLLRSGEINIEVGQRVRFDRYDDHGAEANEAIRLMAKNMRHHYQKHYAEMRRRIETEAYLQPYRQLRDYYKTKV